MSSALEQFHKAFRLDELLIAESEHWAWSVRPVQCTLGAGVLSVRANVERFSEVSPKAGEDLVRMVHRVERTLQTLYAYDKINYLMLMMVDPLVHFHVVPRYERKITRFDRTWRDAGWPGPPQLGGDDVGDETLFAIRDEIKAEARA